MKGRLHYRRVCEMPGLVLSDAHLSDFQFGRHYHLDYHVGIVTQGLHKQTSRGVSTLLGPGSIAIMPPGEIHDGRGLDDGTYTLKTFRISAELMRSCIDSIQESRSGNLPGAATLEDPTLAQRLWQLHAQLPALDALAAQEQWLATLEPLLRRLDIGTSLQVEKGLAAQDWKSVRDFCHAHLADKISLDHLAELCGLGKFQFLRRFERTTGVTPHAWLIRLRLEHACVLLSNGRPALADVANDVGFYDQSHFNRAFRLAYGVTPANY